jgi:hypothetical protein
MRIWLKHYEIIAFTITFDLNDKSYVYCISSHATSSITQQASYIIYVFLLKN